VSNKQMKLTPDPSKVDSLYLYYALSSPDAVTAVQAIAIGSSVPGFNLGQLREIRVPLPPLDVQRAVAAVLGTLDDKVEQNYRMVALADELAESLFRQACEMADTGHWYELGDLVEHLPGKYLAREMYKNGGPYSVYGSNSVMGSHTDYLYEGPLTVMARIGSNCGALAWSGKPAWINNNASALRAKGAADPWFIYRLLQTIDMDQHRAGSGQPFIQVSSLLSSSVMVPSVEQQQQIGTRLRSLAEMADGAAAENKHLVKLRDTLLSPLLSGELSGRSADDLVGDTA